MSKFFLKSKTVIGLLITAIPTLAVIFNITLTEEDQVLISHVGDAIIQLIGLIIAGYGRIKATEKLHV